MPGYSSYPLSVVIPTLGGNILSRTLDCLNKSSIGPGEILLCVPKERSSKAQQFESRTVRVVRTECRGQVAQRAVGFRQAKYDLVLQLDDDIFVRETCIENLVASVSGEPLAAAGPKLYDLESGQYHSFLVPKSENSSWLDHLVIWIINGGEGFAPGQLGRSGVNMGVPEFPDDWADVGWLPGGCILHWKKNLILHDYYPYSGKAFAEDLFHSILLRKQGVILKRCGAATCDFHLSEHTQINPAAFIRGYFAYGRAMRNVAKQINGSVPRLYSYLILNLVARAIDRGSRQWRTKALPDSSKT